MGTRTLDFEVYTNFGKGDSVDWELCYDVTEEEYERLVEVAKEYDDFDEAEAVSDIYDKVYAAAVQQATIDMIGNDLESVEELLEDGMYIDDWRADLHYTIGVNFPYACIERDEE